MSKKFSSTARKIGGTIAQLFAASKLSKSQGLEVLTEVQAQLTLEPSDAAPDLKGVAAHFIATFHEQGANDNDINEAIAWLHSIMPTVDDILGI